MTTDDRRPISAEELAAETAAGLPDKEVVSLLDLNADLNLALDAAAPIDLGVAANANAAAPIEASIGTDVLRSPWSRAWPGSGGRRPAGTPPCTATTGAPCSTPSPVMPRPDCAAAAAGTP